MHKFTKAFISLSLPLCFIANVNAQKIYWSDQPNLKRADLDGSNVEDITPAIFNGPRAVTVNKTESKIYWVDQNGFNYRKSDLDGTNLETLFNTTGGAGTAMAIDETNSNIYHGNVSFVGGFNPFIEKRNLDGSNNSTIISSLSGSVKDIALDVNNSLIYFTVSNTIQTVNFDGSNQQTIVTATSNIQDITLDLTNNKLYYTDQNTGLNTGKVVRTDLDGSNPTDILTALSNPEDIHLDVTNSQIYWGDGGEDKIFRCNFDGTGTETIVTGVSISIADFSLVSADAPLSVELNYFTARQIENSIQLSWATASETENEGFNVYRKLGNEDFVKIASHKSHTELKGQGNTSLETFYTFNDNSKLQNGEFYTYLISDVETNGIETKHEESAQSVLFEVQSQEVRKFELKQNYPNPFNPSTTISYNLAKDSKVSLKIYNEIGEFVKELTNGFRYEGSHNVIWDGTNNNGKSVSSGTYFYKISAGTFTQTNKMILLK
ncbi:MAG: T9SS C-terminal target domain-containing protein [Calditrichaeota bacterium]|nr:MAG: T9SS C-terminal target domain-containing protein [Calditrichota bacterium]